MTLAYTDVSDGATNANRLSQVDTALIQLSDGLPIWLDNYGSGTQEIKYTADRATVSVVAAASGVTNQPSVQSGGTHNYGKHAMCRDAADNLYVAGVVTTGPNTSAGLSCWPKSTGHSWPSQNVATPFNTFGVGSFIDTLAVVWCNTGGGTGGAGHVLVFVSHSFSTPSVRCYVFDAGALLAGSGVAELSDTVIFGGTELNSIDVSPDGFGGANGLAIGHNAGANTVLVDSWSVTAAGAFTRAALTTSSFATGTVGIRTRAVRYAPNAWAVLYPSSSSGWRCARYSSTARLTAAVNGVPTSLPPVAASPASTTAAVLWDAQLDVAAPNTVRVLAQSTIDASVWSASVAVGTGVTWGTTATQEPHLPTSGTTANGLRCVKEPLTTQSYGDWQIYGTISAAFQLKGDFHAYIVAPNAASLTAPANTTTIDRSITQRFSWAFSSNTPGDTQSKADIRYRIGTGAWTTLTELSANTYHDFAGATFTAATYEWQVLTYGSTGLAASAWSASSFFTAGDPPAAPTIVTPTAGATVSATATVSWTTGSQTDYQVRRTADVSGTAGATLWDSGDVIDAATRSLAVAFPTNSDTEHVQVRIEAGGLWSAWADVLVHVSFVPPATPTVALTADSGNPLDVFDPPRIIVAITDPAPTGGQPAVDHLDVYRSDDGQATWVRVATGLASGATWTDYTPASGVDYSYRVVAVATDGTTSTSAAVGTATLIGSFGYGY